MSERIASRRGVLVSACATGLVLPLAGCGDDGGGGDGGDGYGVESSPGERDKDRDSPMPRESAGAELGPTSEIPRGGGKVFTAEKVVVTQPKAGEFKAFSAVCQHKGCLVTTVSDGTINCPCHGSKYDLADGGVVRGPTTKGLPEVNVSVQGGRIRLD